MDNGSGAEKLINTIMDEARAHARQIEADAETKVKTINAKLEADRAALAAEFAERSERLRSDTVARAMTNAELESRKNLLAKKRGLMDRAYSEAYKRICTLPEDKRAALLLKLLKAECEGGEVIHPAPKEDMAAIVKDAGMGLTLGEEDPSIRNGFTVEGKGYFKNCSFTAVMEAAKEQTEAEVASLLFD